MRVVKVQGKGHVSVEPDIVIITFTVAAKSREYSECINQLNARTDALRDSMTKAGVDRIKLRTSDFEVETDTSYDKGTRHFLGYKASHKMNIELPSDKALLNSVLHHVAKGHSETEIKLSFAVKDKDALRKKVLEQAVRTAKVNADTLAAAAGITLGKLVQMDYGWTEIRFYETTADLETCDCLHDSNFDIEPENVKAEDNVTLVFEIAD